MTTDQVHGLIDAIIALLGAITTALTIYNQVRMNALHSKVDTIKTEQEANGQPPDPQKTLDKP